jgi:hypothetical protein
MSTSDIEDVLSSIRRLVSEDLHPTAAKNASPNAAAKRLAGKKAAEPDGKLLLTPALRVVSAQTAPQDAPEAPYVFVDDEPTAEPPLLRHVSPAPDEIIFVDSPSSTASLHENTDDWLPENSDDAEVIPGWANEETAAETPVPVQPLSDVTRVVSEIAAGVSEADEDWEPETGDGPTIAWQAPDWADEVEDVEDHAVGESAARAIADKAEAAVVAEIMALAGESVAGEAAPADTDPEELRFDEAVLRDLVRDLIHEELSGALGERITRNVRKLVRSEINRVHTASTLE